MCPYILAIKSSLAFFTKPTLILLRKGSLVGIWAEVKLFRKQWPNPFLPNTNYKKKSKPFLCLTYLWDRFPCTISHYVSLIKKKIFFTASIINFQSSEYLFVRLTPVFNLWPLIYRCLIACFSKTLTWQTSVWSVVSDDFEHLAFRKSHELVGNDIQKSAQKRKKKKYIYKYIYIYLYFFLSLVFC